MAQNVTERNWHAESSVPVGVNKHVRIWPVQDAFADSWQSQWSTLDVWLGLRGDIIPHQHRKEADVLNHRILNPLELFTFHCNSFEDSGKHCRFLKDFAFLCSRKHFESTHGIHFGISSSNMAWLSTSDSYFNKIQLGRALTFTETF